MIVSNAPRISNARTPMNAPCMNVHPPKTHKADAVKIAANAAIPHVQATHSSPPDLFIL